MENVWKWLNGNGGKWCNCESVCMSCGRLVAVTPLRMSWPTPRTGHHQIPATHKIQELEKILFQSLEKEEKIDANGHSILNTIKYLLHTKYKSSRKDIFKIWKKGGKRIQLVSIRHHQIPDTHKIQEP